MGAIVNHKEMSMADIADSFIGSGEAFCLLDAYIFALFPMFLKRYCFPWIYWTFIK